MEERITAVRVMILKDGPSDRDVNRFKNKSYYKADERDLKMQVVTRCQAVGTVQLQNGDCLHSQPTSEIKTQEGDSNGV